MFKKFFVNFKSLFFIFSAVLLIVAISAVNDLNQGRNEALSILKSQAHSLLETMIISSREVLMASDELESEINSRLLNNAAIIKILLEQKRIDNKILKSIADENNLNRINIFDKDGTLRYTNFDRWGSNPRGPFAQEFLSPIFSGEEDTVIIGIKEARGRKAFRYVVALATTDRSAIVINMDAEDLMTFRKKIGFGILLNKLTENEGVAYTSLEDSSGILAASANIGGLKNHSLTGFNADSINNKIFMWRYNYFDDTEVFEAAHPFELNGELIGTFKIGLSLTPLNNVSEHFTKRILITGVLLLVIGTFILAFIFSKQNFETLKNKYDYIEGFSNQLIRNANDVIIVLDSKKKIKEINPAGVEFFKKPFEFLQERSLNELMCDDAEKLIFENDNSVCEIRCVKNDSGKVLLVSKSEFLDSLKNLFHVLIIKDLTEIKELEDQINRGNQLNAMGHLASGVAHEIRNPLNTIGTIIQQLSRDFEPKEDVEDYKSFTQLVYKEVRRINKTIESFLKLARPEPIFKKRFNFKSFIEEIYLLHENNLKEKNINLLLENKYEGEVFWDEDQIKQVMMNLIANARDAITNSGTIKISAELVNEFVIIDIEDNGTGISEENMNKIFDLYFTTKASGTGIGLGIIQRIINEHGGIINVQSKVDAGSKFTIKIKAF